MVGYPWFLLKRRRARQFARAITTNPSADKLWSIVSKMENAIGIDIGGTTTAVAAVDVAGRIHARAEFETRSDRGFALGLVQLVEAVRRVLSEANWGET